jgi:hypothetical protein
MKMKRLAKIVAFSTLLLPCLTALLGLSKTIVESRHQPSVPTQSPSPVKTLPLTKEPSVVPSPLPLIQTTPLPIQTPSSAKESPVVPSPRTPIQIPLPIETPSSTQEPPVAPPLPTSSQYPGWLICWHGKTNQEFLVAYSETDVRHGIDLPGEMNDSLKMCLLDGTWYGSPSGSHFPTVSDLRLDANQIVVYEHGGQAGRQWALTPSGLPPSVILELLQKPTKAGQTLGRIPTSKLP